MDFIQMISWIFVGVVAVCGIKTVLVFCRSLDVKNEEEHKAYAEKIKNWAAAGIAAGVVVIVLTIWPG